MDLAEALRSFAKKLGDAGVDNPGLDSKLLVGHALGLGPAELLSQSRRALLPKEERAIEVLLAQRIAGKSVARILGRREFWSLDFGLNEATLEPRPDSETLVEAVLKNAKNKKSILDLGTGTGCLLLALLHDLPEAKGLGIDKSSRAVEQAKANAENLGLASRAAFKTGNWLEAVAQTFDIIISNPPYIPSEEIESLMRDVRDFDPLLALDGGEDGLDPYRHLIPKLKDYLNPSGLVAFEVGAGQAGRVAALFREYGYADIAIDKDLGGIERCVRACQPAS